MSAQAMLIFWYTVALAALVGTSIFSGSEIGMFSLSRVRLRLRTHHKEPNALIVQQWLTQPTYALEGLLILQNIASFVFSAAVTGILGTYAFHPLVQAILSTAIITPLILVLTEIMPKDLFNHYADRWIYPLVPLLRVCFRAITVVPLLPVVRFLSRLSMRVVGGGHAPAEPTGPRTEILQLFRESTATGEMTDTQQDLVQRALRMARVTIREVMMPWNRVIGVPSTISRDGFRALVKHYNVSRMPVMGKSTTEVLGTIEVIAVLADTADFNLARHIHPPMTLIGEQSVRSAITLMQKSRQTIAVVVDRNGRAQGLVTMKDLIEELVGDLENW